jgi:hypothetical protein
MSMKRNSSGRGGSTLGGAEVSGKVNRDTLYDDLKRRAAAGEAFNSVDVALSVGASEPHVAKTLLGLAADAVLRKTEVGRYTAESLLEMEPADFTKAFSRASKMDGQRIRDIQEIERLKKNNDIMRARVLTLSSERDHFKSVLDARGINPGPVPVTDSTAKADARVAAHADADAALDKSRAALAESHAAAAAAVAAKEAAIAEAAAAAAATVADVAQ